MKRLLALGLLLGLAFPARALPSTAPVVSFAFGPKEQAKPLLTELETQLRASHRFVIGPAMLPVALDQPLEPTVTRLRKAAKADWVFAGAVTLKDGGFELAGRLYDLKLGDASKPLRFAGASPDLSGLARQLTLFLKTKAPLRGEITGLRDNRVLLNVGAEDGVETGSVFRVTRKPGQPEFEVATLRVTAADAWFATAEVVALKKGARLGPGDAVVEDVGYALIH